MSETLRLRHNVVKRRAIMRSGTNRKFYLPLALALLGLGWPLCARGQSDGNDLPLGDVARSMRTDKRLPARTVIDNDNFSQLMDEVESHRLSGSSLLFSFDALGKTFQVSAPDVTCSLSFNAQASSLLSDPFTPRDLPDAELAKLDGPATVNGDSLQVSVYNGSGWNLREITIGVTLIRRQSSDATYYGTARLLPAAAASAETAAKRSDTTVLYRIKGAAAPLTTTVFSAPLGLALGPDQEWHWAIVEAKGIPPK
jgi:hypothetical protein